MSRQIQGLATEDTGEENRETHRGNQIMEGGMACRRSKQNRKLNGGR
jgi:hypothetical protein